MDKKEKKHYELSDNAKAAKISYIKKYNREMYTTFTFKLRTKEDAEIISKMRSSGKSICSLAKEAIEAYLKQRAVLIHDDLDCDDPDFFTQEKRIPFRTDIHPKFYFQFNSHLTIVQCELPFHQELSTFPTGVRSPYAVLLCFTAIAIVVVSVS